MSATTMTKPKTTKADKVLPGDDSIIVAMQEELTALYARPVNDTDTEPCGKCLGQGYGPWMMDGGRCWNCGATGNGPTRTVGEQIERKRRSISTHRSHLRTMAKAQAEHEAVQAATVGWREENAEVVAAITAYDEAYKAASGYDDAHGLYNRFMADMHHALVKYGKLTEKQTAAVQRGIDSRKARETEDAAAESAPAGRIVVTGEVLSTKWQESAYGSTKKITVKDDRGFRVWMTEPASICTERGDRVTLTVTLEPAPDDRLFAFGKRPSKASVITEAGE